MQKDIWDQKLEIREKFNDLKKHSDLTKANTLCLLVKKTQLTIVISYFYSSLSNI